MLPNVWASCVTSPQSCELFVVVGDSTLYTNKSKGNRRVTALDVQLACQCSSNLMVACWPGGSLSDLETVASAIAGIANIDRLVFVWQGNEYTTVATSQIGEYVVPLLKSVRSSADCVRFVLPASDNVWHYGISYDIFAAEARRAALTQLPFDSDMQFSCCAEFAGFKLTRSHVSSCHYDDVVRAIAQWVLFFPNGTIGEEDWEIIDV